MLIQNGQTPKKKIHVYICNMVSSELRVSLFDVGMYKRLVGRREQPFLGKAYLQQH